ncbi:MAG: hypothetical protein Unbinned6747contig1000_8 [Prokaryotic dsDNA virus sp.]|nr:MAG: hypothetical protein Unbinned6747contig1000_8 [Prokaryotic dsDNA virus sp.]|tara:strand:+ start:26446 stop:26901 length:456 start_codon:yes stop_codon:yes gene_type:complete
MRTTIDISKAFNLNKIKFDLSKEINESAKAIVKDHDNRLNYGQGVDGKMMTKLQPSTIKSKRLKGYKKPRTPLYATGTMKNIRIDKKATRMSQEARLTPPLSRIKPDEIGAFHQAGVGHLPKREWFGVTKKVEKKLLKFMELKINRILKNA